MIDFVILQRAAFDKIDASTPMDRQQYMLDKVLEVNSAKLNFDSFEDVQNFFKQVINEFKQMNYSEFKSEKFIGYEQSIAAMLKEKMN